MNKTLKIYAFFALIIGIVYWYHYQTPELFVLLFGIRLLLKSIKLFIEKNIDDFYLNIGFSAIIIITGIGILL